MKKKLCALLVLSSMVTSLWNIPVLAANITAQGAVATQWKQETPMPTARVRPMPVAINGKIYVFGGNDTIYVGPSPTNLTTVEIYDPVTGRWTTGAPIPVKTFCGDVAVNGNEVYFYGASKSVNNKTQYLCLKYDTVTNQWEETLVDKVGSIPSVNNSSSAAFYNGKVYITDTGNNKYGWLQTFDAITHEEDGYYYSYSPILNSYGVLFEVINGNLYNFTKSSMYVFDDNKVRDDGGIGDFVSYKSYSAGSVPTNATSVNYENKLIQIGGWISRNVSYSNAVKGYDVETGKTIEYPNMLENRTAPGAIVLNGKLYVLGGTDYVYQSGNKENVLKSMESLQLGDPNEIYATGISMNRSTAQLDADIQQTLQLQSSITPAATWDQRVVWTSTNPLVASVDENGIVTALSGGETRITATTVNGGYSAVCYITVNQTIIDAESVEITPATSILEEGETLTLTAEVQPANTTDQTLTWISSDQNIATVDADGIVTAVAAGQATITVTAHNGVSSDCIVTVTAANIAATGVSVTPPVDTIVVGGQLQVNAQVLPSDATNQTVIWSSSDPSIADVDNDGLVTAIAEGTATITATTIDGSHTDSCIVTVIDNSSGDINLALGATATASSVHNNNNNANGAQNAIDGNGTTRWLAVANEMTSFLEIDFGSAVTFNSIEIEHLRIGGYELEYYDGSGWVVFYSDELTNRDAIDLSFAEITASKIRIMMYSKYGAVTNGYQITEFRVFNR